MIEWSSELRLKAPIKHLRIPSTRRWKYGLIQIFLSCYSSQYWCDRYRQKQGNPFVLFEDLNWSPSMHLTKGMYICSRCTDSLHFLICWCRYRYDGLYVVEKVGLKCNLRVILLIIGRRGWKGDWMRKDTLYANMLSRFVKANMHLTRSPDCLIFSAAATGPATSPVERRRQCRWEDNHRRRRQRWSRRRDDAWGSWKWRPNWGHVHDSSGWKRRYWRRRLLMSERRDLYLTLERYLSVVPM